MAGAWRSLKQEERLQKEGESGRQTLPDPLCYLLEQGRNPAGMLLADEGEGWECEEYHGRKLHHVTQLSTYELDKAQELRNKQCTSFWGVSVQTEGHEELMDSVEMLFLFVVGVFLGSRATW